ncbi:MAG: glycogen-binding domain-containing protein [Longimicrobiales bacterium]|nr:glycogen-binding domain-containing protein [Longimicrobiales bacterium]
MNEETRRYLDGEVTLAELGEGERREAAAWDRLLGVVRSENADSPAPHWLEDRVMAEIAAMPEPGPFARAWGWLLRPQSLRVSPLTLGLAAAGLAALLLVQGNASVPSGTPALPGGAATPVVAGMTVGGAVVYVQFSLEAPGASSVRVAGDFDEWRGSYELTDPDGDGVWSGRVPVQPGMHTYMFLVDGAWVSDPRADRYTDDGFGNRNAVLAVAGPLT